MKYICRIGTNPSNDLVINDRTASDFHAQLIMDSDSKVFIRDLESRYGTRVNGNRVDKIELFAGDTVRIGFMNVDWEKTVNDWILLNEDEMEQKEVLLSESENAQGQAQQSLSFRLASEAGKMRQEYFPGETGINLRSDEVEKEEKSRLPKDKAATEVISSELKELKNRQEIESDQSELEKSKPSDSLENNGQEFSVNEQTPNEIPLNSLPNPINKEERVGVHVVPHTRVKSGNLNQAIQKQGNWLIQVLGIFSAVIALLLAGWMLAWITR